MICCKGWLATAGWISFAASHPRPDKAVLRSSGGLDGLGGEIPRRAFLELGEKHGYNHRGMAGFYHVLVAPTPHGRTQLTEAGRERLKRLRARYLIKPSNARARSPSARSNRPMGPSDPLSGNRWGARHAADPVDVQAPARTTYYVRTVREDGERW